MSSNPFSLSTNGSSTNSADNRIPDSPTASLDFGVYSQEAGKHNFRPIYYPERFTITTEKELQRVGSGCGGQKVSIDELKNSELHVTGKVHTSDLQGLNDIIYSTEPVDLVTPVVEGGGMEAFVKSGERGDILSYDAYPTAEEWMFEYTLDFVSTGKDEYESHTKSRYEPSEDSEDDIPDYRIPGQTPND